jgi:aryl-alcohol dehydrogenase/geraniol dehydrogenase (NAD+)
MTAMNSLDRLFEASARGTKAVTGRAAILSEPNGTFSLEDVLVQEPRKDEVLVRIAGVGVCHTDVVCKGAFPVPMPIVLGHEGSGVVEAVGVDVTDIGIGDHVVLSFGSCGTCPNCAKSFPAYCYNFMAENFASTRGDGSTPMYQGERPINARFFGQSSFATHVIANQRNTVVVPKSAPLELLGPLGCGFQTGAGAILNSLGVNRGDKVVVFGGGSVGLSAVMAAKIAEASVVILVEPIAERRRLALEIGATHTIDPKGEEDVGAAIKSVSGGVTHALDTTGIPAVIAMAHGVLLPMGFLGLLAFSPPDANLPLNIMDMLIRGVTVKMITEGNSNPKTFIPQLVDYHLQGRLPIEKLITQYELDEINEAFEAAESGKAIKPVMIV